ncbi:hydroxypyruvate isomerase family protein [uncultured Caballeronia sp.]|uniref:hydroxypyruvate isomerase family protein n=1 Tax=uncultured Caballeronia sp. TaxID=1827198 RepID=UPI0035CBF633
MPRFSANISILFCELPFIQRFAAAKEAGFAAVECWFPYEHGLEEIAGLLRDLKLEMVGINTAHGGALDWGLAALPGRERDFLESLDQALDCAVRFGSCAVHVMGGLAGAIPRTEAWRTYVANLELAVRRAEGSGVQLLIEPLNSRDRPGYILHSADQASELIDHTGLGALKIMFDCYHVQVEEGDLVTRLRRHWEKIGHIQIASSPDRTEPGTGEIDFAFVFDEVDRLGWKGWIGAEYRPSLSTGERFHWMNSASASAARRSLT